MVDLTSATNPDHVRGAPHERDRARARRDVWPVQVVCAPNPGDDHVFVGGDRGAEQREEPALVVGRRRDPHPDPRPSCGRTFEELPLVVQRTDPGSARGPSHHRNHRRHAWKSKRSNPLPRLLHRGSLQTPRTRAGGRWISRSAGARDATISPQSHRERRRMATTPAAPRTRRACDRTSQGLASPARLPATRPNARDYPPRDRSPPQPPRRFAGQLLARLLTEHVLLERLDALLVVVVVAAGNREDVIEATTHLPKPSIHVTPHLYQLDTRRGLFLA